jgi:hypothetical protein
MKRKAKPTDGPWSNDPDFPGVVLAGKVQIAAATLTKSRSKAERDANARLLASAWDYDAAARQIIAPYAAVTDAQLRHAARNERGTLEIPINAEIAAAVLALRAVIAKHQL